MKLPVACVLALATAAIGDGAIRLAGRSAPTVRVAAVQAHSKFGDPAGNRKTLAKQITAAAAGGAKIVVLPETAVTGYMPADLKRTWQVPLRAISTGLVGVDPKDAAETVPGPSTKFFGLLASKLGIYLTVPLLEVDRKTGLYYNTSVLVGPDGRILLHYRKRNPWPWAEKGWADEGDRGNPVVDTPLGRLGLLICFDIHEQAKIMGRLKVDILLYSIAWVDDKDSPWFDKQLPAIARANGFSMIAANWTVPATPKPTWHGYGQTRIIAADGKILVKATDDLKEEIVYAELPIAPKAPKDGKETRKTAK